MDMLIDSMNSVANIRSAFLPQPGIYPSHCIKNLIVRAHTSFLVAPRPMCRQLHVLCHVLHNTVPDFRARCRGRVRCDVTYH